MLVVRISFFNIFINASIFQLAMDVASNMALEEDRAYFTPSFSGSEGGSPLLPKFRSMFSSKSEFLFALKFLGRISGDRCLFHPLLQWLEEKEGRALSFPETRQIEMLTARIIKIKKTKAKNWVGKDLGIRKRQLRTVLTSSGTTLANDTAKFFSSLASQMYKGDVPKCWQDSFRRFWDVPILTNKNKRTMAPEDVGKEEKEYVQATWSRLERLKPTTKPIPENSEICKAFRQFCVFIKELQLKKRQMEGFTETELNEVLGKRIAQRQNSVFPLSHSLSLSLSLTLSLSLSH